jgi:C4-dicarboxylate-specific signal transduction histidine kinase
VQSFLPTATVPVHELLESVAEQLKLPLMNIARQAELAQLLGEIGPAGLSSIQAHAVAALTLVDSYMLGLELARNQETLVLEPVSVSSVLTEAAHALEAFAKQYGVIIELEIGGKYGPVMGNSTGLRAALISLGYELIEAQASHTRSAHLTLAATRNTRGIAAGIYSEYGELQTEHWRRAIELCGHAKQPFTTLTAGSGAGIFVADTILQAMDTRLRIGHYHKQRGLVADLRQSPQLQLV